MKKIAVLLAVVLGFTSVSAQEVHFVGGSRSTDFYLKLATLLGPSYMVSYSTGSLFHYIYRADWKNPDPKPVITVVDLLPSDWHHWGKSIDSFVPEARSKVRSLMVNPKNFYLLIPRSDTAVPTLSTQYIPLLKQVARESGANVIDLNDPSFQGPNSEGQEAKKIYVTLVKVQHTDGSWRLVSFTSEQSDEGPAKNAIDNDPNTYWHTRYDPNPTKVPHEIVIDLGKQETLAGFSYLARQDGGVNGRVKDFEVYVGDDVKNWSSPVLKGTLQNSMEEQRLLFARPAKGRYLRFRALSEVNGGPWTSVAELGVISRSRMLPSLP